MKGNKISVKELLKAIEEIEIEKGISKEYLIEALKLALETAYNKNYGTNENVSVDLNEEKKEIRIYATKLIVDEVNEPNNEISLSEAKTISKRAKLGESINIEVTPKDFGRLAATAGKQIIVQKLREAERNMVYTQYSDKQGQIVTGVVERTDKYGIIVNLGRVEALVSEKEQVKGEKFDSHQKIRCYVNSVNENSKYGPQIVLSRRNPQFVKKLFEVEIPEIAEGIVEIKAIAREAGSRTKIAVFSNDENVDPVGTCVGKKGVRILPIIEELFGERIDVVPYSEDVPSFIINAISPAEVLAIDLNDEEKIATLVVEDDSLALAIGAGGQNVRLAAILTGWKIDIKTETQIKEQAIE